MTLQEAWQALQSAQSEYDDAHEWEMQKGAEVNALREQIAALTAQLDPAVSAHFAAVGGANQKFMALQAAQQAYNQALGHEVAPTLIPAPTGQYGPRKPSKRKKHGKVRRPKTR